MYETNVSHESSTLSVAVYGHGKCCCLNMSIIRYKKI